MSSSASPRTRSTSTLSDQEWLRSLAVAMPEPEAWHNALRKGNSTAVAKQLRKRLSALSGQHLLNSLRWSCDPQADSLTIDVIDELAHLLKRKGRQVVELLSGMIEAWLDHQAAVAVPSQLDQLLASIVLVEQAGRLSDAVLVRLWRFVEERTGQAARSKSTTHVAVQELLHLEQQLFRMLAAATQSPSAFVVKWPRVDQASALRGSSASAASAAARTRRTTSAVVPSAWTSRPRNRV